MKTNRVTNREIEVLLAASRYGIRDAAVELEIKEQTVKNTLVTVYRKLEARGMAHAVLILAEGRR